MTSPLPTQWKQWALIGSACLIAVAAWAEAPKPEAAKVVERLKDKGNSLGMKFAPIPNVPNGLQVLGCIHETRSKDFAAFIADKNRGYEMTGRGADDWRTYELKGIPVGRGKDEKAENSAHPVCNVNYSDAQAFCQWLTTKERSEGLIGSNDAYRLPADAEWSLMVGLGEEKGSTPAERSANGDSTHYPWAGPYPPTGKAANYADETAKAAGTTVEDYYIKGYTDGFATTAPVMSFAPNSKGFYDLGGNAWEWCEDWYEADKQYRVLRGTSWFNGDASGLLSSFRGYYPPGDRFCSGGFRCVLVVASGS